MRQKLRKPTATHASSPTWAPVGPVAPVAPLMPAWPVAPSKPAAPVAPCCETPGAPTGPWMPVAPLGPARLAAARQGRHALHEAVSWHGRSGTCSYWLSFDPVCVQVPRETLAYHMRLSRGLLKLAHACLSASNAVIRGLPVAPVTPATPWTPVLPGAPFTAAPVGPTRPTPAGPVAPTAPGGKSGMHLRNSGTEAG